VIRDIPKPVIAAVNGYAIGGGHVLHVLCDLTIAADTAQFGQVGPRVGSFDAGFGSTYLARVVGEKRAREIWYLCRRLRRRHRERWGLVNRRCPADRLLRRAEGLGRRDRREDPDGHRVPQACVQRRHRASGRPASMARAPGAVLQTRNDRKAPRRSREAGAGFPVRAMNVLAERDGPGPHRNAEPPDKLNALDCRLPRPARRALHRRDRDRDVRDVVLTGHGRGFLRGADLAVVAGIAADRSAFDSFLRRWHTSSAPSSGVASRPSPPHRLRPWRRFELTQVCDLSSWRLGRLGDQHANFGLFPGGGSTQRLPRLRRPAGATWCCCPATRSIPTARAFGLANRVVPTRRCSRPPADMALHLAERSTRRRPGPSSNRCGTGSTLPLGDALDGSNGHRLKPHWLRPTPRRPSRVRRADQPDFGYQRSVEVGGT